MSEGSSADNNNNWKYAVGLGIGVPVTAFLLYKLLSRNKNNDNNKQSYDIRKFSYYKTKVYKVYEKIKVKPLLSFFLFYPQKIM